VKVVYAKFALKLESVRHASLKLASAEHKLNPPQKVHAYSSAGIRKAEKILIGAPPVPPLIYVSIIIMILSNAFIRII
jgi:hypothetical protein